MAKDQKLKTKLSVAKSRERSDTGDQKLKTKVHNQEPETRNQEPETRSYLIIAMLSREPRTQNPKTIDQIERSEIP